MNPGGVNERGRGEIDPWDRARAVFKSCIIHFILLNHVLFVFED